MGTFLEQNSYVVVLGAVLVIWCGVFLYMLRIEKRVKKLEEKK
jgi:CcmD family protein